MDERHPQAHHDRTAPCVRDVGDGQHPRIAGRACPSRRRPPRWRTLTPVLASQAPAELDVVGVPVLVATPHIPRNCPSARRSIGEQADPVGGVHCWPTPRSRPTPAEGTARRESHHLEVGVQRGVEGRSSRRNVRSSSRGVVSTTVPSQADHVTTSGRSQSSTRCIREGTRRRKGRATGATSRPPRRWLNAHVSTYREPPRRAAIVASAALVGAPAPGHAPTATGRWPRLLPATDKFDRNPNDFDIVTHAVTPCSGPSRTRRSASSPTATSS